MERREQLWRNRPAPAPKPQKYGVSYSGAERLVRDWIQHLGALETIVTRPTVDGGIDVVSDDYVAQVNYDGSVGVEAIRELFGVATSMTT